MRGTDARGDRPRYYYVSDGVIGYDDEGIYERGYRRSGSDAPASAGTDATGRGELRLLSGARLRVAMAPSTGG